MGTFSATSFSPQLDRLFQSEAFQPIRLSYRDKLTVTLATVDDRIRLNCERYFRKHWDFELIRGEYQSLKEEPSSSIIRFHGLNRDKAMEAIRVLWHSDFGPIENSNLPMEELNELRQAIMSIQFVSKTKVESSECRRVGATWVEHCGAGSLIEWSADT